MSTGLTAPDVVGAEKKRPGKKLVNLFKSGRKRSIDEIVKISQGRCSIATDADGLSMNRERSVAKKTTIL